MSSRGIAATQIEQRLVSDGWVVEILLQLTLAPMLLLSPDEKLFVMWGINSGRKTPDFDEMLEHFAKHNEFGFSLLRVYSLIH